MSTWIFWQWTHLSSFWFGPSQLFFVDACFFLNNFISGYLDGWSQKKQLNSWPQTGLFLDHSLCVRCLSLRCIQEARYGISVWGYVHLEWPSDKAPVGGWGWEPPNSRRSRFKKMGCLSVRIVSLFWWIWKILGQDRIWFPDATHSPFSWHLLGRMRWVLHLLRRAHIKFSKL